MNCPEKKKITHPTPGGPGVGEGLGVNISKVQEMSRTAGKIDKTKLTPTPPRPPHPIRRGGVGAKMSK